MADDELLKALGKLAREERDEAVSVHPLDEEVKERMAALALAQLHAAGATIVPIDAAAEERLAGRTPQGTSKSTGRTPQGTSKGAGRTPEATVAMVVPFGPADKASTPAEAPATAQKPAATVVPLAAASKPAQHDATAQIPAATVVPPAAASKPAQHDATAPKPAQHDATAHKPAATVVPPAAASKPAQHDATAQRPAATVVPLASRRWVRAAIAVPLALAASLALWWTAGISVEKQEPLPAYSVSMTGGLSELRAEPTPGEPLVLGPGARLELVLRPQTPVVGPVVARLFVVIAGQMREWPAQTEVSDQGAVRLVARADALGAVNVPELELVVLVGRAEALSEEQGAKVFRYQARWR